MQLSGRPEPRTVEQEMEWTPQGDLVLRVPPVQRLVCAALGALCLLVALYLLPGGLARWRPFLGFTLVGALLLLMRAWLFPLDRLLVNEGGMRLLRRADQEVWRLEWGRLEQMHELRAVLRRLSVWAFYFTPRRGRGYLLYDVRLNPRDSIASMRRQAVEGAGLWRQQSQRLDLFWNADLYRYFRHPEKSSLGP